MIKKLIVGAGILCVCTLVACYAATALTTRPIQKSRNSVDRARSQTRIEQANQLNNEAYHAWHHDHDAAKAQAKYKELLASGSLKSEALIGLARIAEEQGHSREALHYYDALLGPHPDWHSSTENEPTVVGRFAELCEEQGRYEDALAAYSKVLKLGAGQNLLTYADHNVPIRIDTNDPIEVKARALILIGLAHQLSQGGQRHPDPIALKKSLTAYQTAVQLEPNLAITHYYLAYGLKSQGKTREATAEYAVAEKVGGPEFSAAMHKAENDLQARMAESERNSRVVHVSSTGPNSAPVTWSEPKHPKPSGEQKSADKR